MVGRLSLDVRQMFSCIMAPRRIGGPPTAAESLRPMRVVRLRNEGRLNDAASWIASRNGAALIRGASLMRRAVHCTPLYPDGRDDDHRGHRQ
jgi:hypothetical protein